MRAGEVIREGGYDGEYGTIRLFKPDELESGKSISLLFELPEAAPPVGAAFLSAVARRAKAERRDKERKSKQSITGYTEDTESGVGSALAREGYSGPAEESPASGLPTNSSPMLVGLDSDQRAAAEIVDGPLLIVAGPGTGKTRTLTHRIAHLIADHGVAPEACLAITFTRRAAGEMRERLASLLPDGRGSRPPVMTFHALGLAILREQEDKLGLGAPLRVAGESEALAIARETLGVSALEARRLISDRAARPAAYERALRARGLVDFDDLIALPVRLLTTHADLAAHYRARWPHLSVDEYQDIDAQQYQLVRLLASSDAHGMLVGRGLSPTVGHEARPTDTASLCAIGDPDQAIYGFRGTDVRFFQQFQADYPAARVVSLTRNYRSTRTIVDAALQAVAPTTLVRDRVLHAQTVDASRVILRECATERAEAEFVVETIERLVGGTSLTSFDTGRASGATARACAFNDFAVLYRTDAQTPPLMEALARSGLPFQKRAHTPLVEHPTVVALLARLKTLSADAPLSDRLAAATALLVREEKPDPDLRAITDALRPLAEKHGASLDAFVSELTLGVDIDLHDPRAERVSLLTLHAAKGLEFRVVFLVGCEDGLLPHRFSFDEAGDIDIAEERRLFFVGLTRARERLFLTHTRRRHWRGELCDRSPSPFLRAIREALLDRQKEAAPATPRVRQLELF
jgi:DNA helicase-2/ATP-dependent DNA helicase PcrA